MITSLITLLIVALVLFLFWKYVLGTFINDATVMNIIGIVIGLGLFLYGLRLFHVATP